MRQNRAFQKGFTLVELVVVVAVLAILAGLVLPRLDTFKTKANKATAASNMHAVDRFITQHKAVKETPSLEFEPL